MQVSFYDKNFKGLQDNASLNISNGSYKFIKRGIDFNSLNCICEPYTENIQPTFIVIKNSVGNYVTGALAGIPEINKDNQTVVNASDLKTMFNCDAIIEYTTYANVNAVINYIFSVWQSQVNQGSFTAVIEYKPTAINLPLTSLIPAPNKGIYNVWSEMQNYLKFYNLFMEANLDLINKKVIFTVGKTMYRNFNLRLWEYGIKDFGKWVANVNEAIGYVKIGEEWTQCMRWILTSKNIITQNVNSRDIYPIKLKIILKESHDIKEKIKLVNEVNSETLTTLCDSLYNENIVFNANGYPIDLETNIAVYVRKGQQKYKDLPVGELVYNENGLVSVQAGYRFTGLEFIL